MNFSILPVWVKPVALVLAAVLLIGAGFASGYHVRDLSADAAATKVQNNLLADQLNNINKQLVLQAEGQKAITDKLARVPSKDTIREIVKVNPSGCTLPSPVTDGLRDQVSKANAARSTP